MAAYVLHSSGSFVVGRLAVARPRRAIVVPERSQWTTHAMANVHHRDCLGLRQDSIGPACVAKVLGPTSEERESEERFLDVHAILSEYNPLTGNHLLIWEDSDDEDGAVQAELPQLGAWEDSSSGYQGLEHQPSWIDYRDGSESDDPERLRGPTGAYNALAAVMPELVEDTTSPTSAYSPEAGFQEISVVELEERLATGQFSLLLDVRSRHEYDSGHIAGAFNLPLDPDLSSAARSGSLDEFKDRSVAVVCGSGMRSGQATVRLTKVFGFSNVTNVKGGMVAWTQEGLPMQVMAHQHRGSSGGGCGCGGGGGSGGCKSKQTV